ncbi:hypothetical protein DMC01_12565 [Campylobacter troglodytis]|nr:hypothetical protein DMC01_12565 [Campylobacter troglodytis]
MKQKFEWGKFVLDCFICFMATIISPFALFYPMKIILGSLPILSDVSIFIGIVLPSSLVLCIISIFYKIYKPSLIFGCVMLVLFAIYIQYIFNFSFTK